MGSSRSRSGLIEHQQLHGPTADLVRQSFGTASYNALSATFAAVVGFLLWMIGIAPIYQDLYARHGASERAHSPTRPA